MRDAASSDILPPVSPPPAAVRPRPVPPSETPAAAAAPDHEPRNLLVLAAHHVVLRVGWIFKTESVIMPTFVDAIAGAGWVRGMLPFLNRIGQSVPAMILADRLRDVRWKKRALLGTTLLMAAPFLVLSAAWLLLVDQPSGGWWLPAAFLLLYFAFFAATGLSKLSFATLQGKLIRAERRGRLMGLAGTFGAVPAILCAWFLLGEWVRRPDGGFALIFGFAGAGFVAAALIPLALVEPGDRPTGRRGSWTTPFADAFSVFRGDARFRRLAVLTMLFVTAQLLFPHYAALGRRQSGYESTLLMVWVVAQNAGAGLFSMAAGSVADRFGNRLALRLEITATALTPLLALMLTAGDVGGVHFYWMVFVLLGLVPVAFRTLVNYTLELAEPEMQPRYVSTLKVCMAVPFCLSPLAGLLVDAAGFAAVFIGIAALTALGGLWTFRLDEPRGTAGRATLEGPPADLE